MLLEWWGDVVTSDLGRDTKQTLLTHWNDLGDGLPTRATDGLEEAIAQGWLKLRDGRWHPARPGPRRDTGPAESPQSAAAVSATPIDVATRRAARQVDVDDVCAGCPLLEWINNHSDAGGG